MKQLLSSFAKNTVFANIGIVLLFLAGGMALVSMVRENFPEFSLDMITISVAYPGADPEEVEEGISRKIEEAVEGIKGVKLYTTEAREGLGTCLIEVKENYEIPEVLERVRTGIDAISNFPVDAERPVVKELLLKDIVSLLCISGNMSERRIKEWGESLKDDIQQLPGITQVELFGARNYEISIEVSEQQLRKYGLTFAEIAEAIRSNNLNLAGGTVRTTGEEIRVRTMGRKYTGKALERIIVKALPDGKMLTLGRIANVRDVFEEDPINAKINGDSALMIIVNKTSEEDALAISKTLHHYVEKKTAQLPPDLTFKILYDNTSMLKSRINLLIKNGFIGLVIVLTVLWAFLNARLSFWVGMGIPVSIAGALAILWAIGGTINMISLFGLIMVLGIVVDDAIIVGESIYVHRKQGKPPLKAAVDGVTEVGMPVLAAVLTTIVAFIPLMYVGGVMGKFIAIMPVVVISCLLVSLIESLILLPAHLNHIPDLNLTGDTSNQRKLSFFEKLNQITSSGMEWFVEYMYVPFLSKALHWRYVSLFTAICILLITIGVFRGGILKFEVFPKVDGFIITSTVEFPEGTPPEVTRDAVEKIDAALLRLEKKTKTTSGEPMIEDRLSIVGQSLGEIPKFGPHIGAVQGILIPSEKRGAHTKDLMVAWEKEIGAIPGVKSLIFSGLNTGPPGDPIEVWLQGHQMNTIVAAGEDLMKRLEKFDGVYQIRSDYSRGKKELRLTLKPEARSLGVTLELLASQVFTGYYGYEALRLQRGRDDIRVKVRYTKDERSRLADLENIRIRTPNGTEIPLVSVANMHYEAGYSTITRTNGMRRIAVSAGVDTNKANAKDIFEELIKNYFPSLKKNYPDVHVALQGEQKKMRESFNTLIIGGPLALLGIFVIIAAMFRSYLQVFVIFFTIPFGIIGAVIGHLLMGLNFSIMSIFGMVALTGVVVNDAIVLIERINENFAHGMPFFESIINGGKRRFRAIFLTTVSTVGGLLPLILETDLQAKFLVPMALSIAAGVFFATVLTLVLIPSLVAIVNDLRLLSAWISNGKWPKRLSVEPAQKRYL